MTIKKEYCLKEKRCIIRSNGRSGHNHTLALLNKLLEEARKIAPEIADNKIDIVVYGGERHPFSLGIEFQYTLRPDNFKLVKKIEPELKNWFIQKRMQTRKD